ELERTGADRLGGHLRRPALEPAERRGGGREHGAARGLRPPKIRGRLAVGGRRRSKAASVSPMTAISLTLAYQSLRGFLRNFCSETPRSMSQVHFTSLAVNGLPSCHLTPSRSLKVSWVLSAFHAQLVASSGTMVSGLFCALCWS